MIIESKPNLEYVVLLPLHGILYCSYIVFGSLGDFDIRNGVTSQFSPDPTIITCLQKYKIVTSRLRKSKVNSGDSSITVATI